jgi:hypothetical protein
MLQNNAWTLSQLPANGRHPGAIGSPLRVAAALFDQAHFRAQIGLLKSWLLGRANRLLHLGSAVADSQLREARYAGVRSLPIRHIRGSEGRCHDFDADFRPLKTHNKSRWLRLAAAWQQGVVLPPVLLIQVADAYFVRDGHHRISVARAFGREQIEAEVIVWDMVRRPPEMSEPVTGQVAYQLA